MAEGGGSAGQPDLGASLGPPEVKWLTAPRPHLPDGRTHFSGPRGDGHH